MKIDFHVHTDASSDSTIKAADLAKKSKKLSIIPAITDHNSIVSNSRVKSLKVPFIPGEEIATDRGDLTALFVNELIPKKTPFAEALDLIHEQGALAYLPHMFDKTRYGAVPNEKEASKIDIIEVFNSRCLSDVYNSRAKTFAKKHKILSAVGSDSHFLFEFGSTYATLPDFDLDDPKALLKSLKSANFTTKKAPFYVRGTTSLVKLKRKILG